MFDKEIDYVVEHYGSLLSEEGKRAFVAKCVRRGYTDRADHKDSAVMFFESRDISYAGLYRDTPSQGISIATICRQKQGRRLKVQGVRGHMFDCEREGLFDAAAKAAEHIGDDLRAAAYQRLEAFVQCGPFDEGYLFMAADMAREQVTVAKNERDAVSLLQNADYLRRRGEAIRAFMKGCRTYDLA